MFTERDAENLDFLRSLSNDALLNWYSQASDDDITYAQELLDRWELALLTMDAEERGFTVIDIPTTTLQ